MRKTVVFTALLLLGWPAPGKAAGPGIAVVAAENFYGDLARQIGGDRVAVASIMSNPDQDPHLFEASAQTARDLAGARLVIYNGADYDPWMAKLMAASPAPNRVTIVVADLLHRKAGENPHLWYDPNAMPAAARQMAADLETLDPAHKGDYEAHLAAFLGSLKPMDAKVAALRRKYAGTPATATEPVFGYMADAIGLKMRNMRFQIAVMNDAEPAASEVAQFENDLRQHKVKLLVYNSQATEDLAKRMRDIAVQSHVPVIGVTETEPPGMDYQQWMLTQLDALQKALSAPVS
ncbi:MAG: metal ABC transporter solute-binding protein, Zn/Mn family [Acetobacteraceae bacterium]